MRCTTPCRKTSPAQRDQNLTDFMHELNAVGLTGVYSLGQSDFLAARAAKGPLPIRLWETLTFNATDPASATQAAALIERSQPNQFDGQLGIFGLGEVLYGPFFDLAPRKEPWPAEIMNEYGKLATAAARAGWHVHQHVINNNAVTDLLDTLEKVNKTQRIDRLRWTMGHVYDISAANIARAKALGMTLGVHGAAMQAGARMPLRRIADSGIVFGLGTDATIVSHYNPFVTLGWVVSGLDVGGNQVLDETLTREEALDRAYALERVSVLSGEGARLARGGQAGRPRRARPRLHDRACRRDQAHSADADDGGRASGVQRREVDARAISTATNIGRRLSTIRAACA